METKHKEIILNCEKMERRFALLSGGRLEEYKIERDDNTPQVGDIYLGKIINLDISLQAAFVDYGTGKNGFLPFSEIHPDYYQVTPEQKKKLLELAHANIVDDDDDPNDEEDEVAEYDDHSAGEDNKEFVVFHVLSPFIFAYCKLSPYKPRRVFL